LNIPFKDVKLRRELLALLPQVGLDQESLLTLDDLSLDGASKPSQGLQLAEFTLVDHNVLSGPLARDSSPKIVAIIDHHLDARRPLAANSAGPRIVVNSGSCTSLVVNYLQKDWNAVLPPSGAKQDGVDAATAVECSAEVATLALASILVDTQNLTEKSKTTEADVVAVDFLRSKLPLSFDCASFFARLQEAKQSIDGLSIEDILRKDYKQFVTGDMSLGISSAVRSLSYLANELGGPDSAFVVRARTFAESRGLDVYIVMSAYSNTAGEFQRDLLVCGLSPKGAEAARKFAEHHCGDLALEDLEGGWSGGVDGPAAYQRAFRQRALHQSRKQIAPMITGTMAQL
jgi:exopolyphosphatase